MTRKDFARYFNVGETLEITGHWRKPSIIGNQRIVRTIGRICITFDVPNDYPSDMPYRDVVRLERQDGCIRVEWADDCYVTYRVVGG